MSEIPRLGPTDHGSVCHPEHGPLVNGGRRSGPSCVQVRCIRRHPVIRGLIAREKSPHVAASNVPPGTEQRYTCLGCVRGNSLKPSDALARERAYFQSDFRG